MNTILQLSAKKLGVAVGLITKLALKVSEHFLHR